VLASLRTAINSRAAGQVRTSAAVQRLGESGHGARPTQNASALDVKPFAQRIVTRRRRAEGGLRACDERLDRVTGATV